MFPRTYHRVLFALFSVFLLAPVAWGGGVWLYEGGTPDLGTAGAGRAALADDASTAGANPAGMTRLDRQIRIGTGIQYDWNKDVTLGFAYEYLDAGDAEIDQEGGPLQGPLKGDYDTNAIHFFAVNLIWKF